MITLKSLILYFTILVVLLLSSYNLDVDAFSVTIEGRNRITPTSSSVSLFTTTTYSSSTCTFQRKVVLQQSSQNDNESDKEKNSKRKSKGSSGSDDNNEPKETGASPLLSLPPIGESSFDFNSNVLSNDQPKEVGLVGSRKFELQYTCKMCETRNVHKVSRLAYTKGVVITVCKGCMAKHLIADNLGWSKFWGDYGFDGKTNIEEYMDEIGRGDEVNRVSKDVFHLEQILDDGEEGIVSSSIVDDADAFE
eukprot:CAMPEP_0203673224 /NCGR_PEP_ID=MMETSP0090-20130426/11451_1 /ASSEMBLY_ACC=CAM_ASM_001088 /TAXON_ID=426623 /ORGANISM="Chaetoceros affinis, Strain CCMP159" /LENGTH=249 /DNA_ID=CAMNT_0050538815 /DNA_START=64 /DNA_END=813 /DNA_ORIENTATION=+